MRIVPAFAFSLLLSLPAMAIQQDQARVDQIFAEYDHSKTPGCELGVIRNGAFIYRKGYGAASLELEVPLSAQSVFYMGSVSKQFTAASVVLAAQQGFFSLDDNIRKFIPELPDYGQPVTMRQMLHHTSGFRDVLGLLELSGRSALDRHSSDELIDLIVRQKALNFKPGAEYLYSNTNYFLLAEVIKRTTKKSLAVFAAENIFKPLGMTHTRFYDDSTLVLPGRVPAYEPGGQGDFKVNWSTNFAMVGAGGLMSRLDDLLLWDRNFYDNRLGNGSFLAEMQTRGVLNDGRQITYALGLVMDSYRGLPVVEHSGSLLGYQTEILRFPEQRFTVVCLCNLSSANPTSFAHRIADIYLEKSLQPMHASTKEAGGTAKLDSFNGIYLNPLEHSVILFTASSDHLEMGGLSLSRIGDDRFQTPGGTVIEFDNSGGRMKMTGRRGDQVAFSGEKTIAPSIGLMP
jgi:CubicO group peptidase (beta-lactamase class C family)